MSQHDVPADAHEQELPPDQAPAADLPVHARERLTRMRGKFFTSDLSVNEFLLVKEIGFDPLGMVMGSSIYHVKPQIFGGSAGAYGAGAELDDMTTAMLQSRELAIGRLEEEAQALGADGVIGVRLDINMHAWGSSVLEFVAVGTAVRYRAAPGHLRNKDGLPFTSALSGQDFWTLLRSGWRPVGFVMGNCVWYVPPRAVNQATGWGNMELAGYTHALYDARELAMERLQVEAEELDARGIVGVAIHEKQHNWRNFSAILQGGETIEFFVVGTAIVPMELTRPIPVPTLAIEVTR